eukprot:NODE_80_length_22759_cov_1.466858.p7 type:complete len:322 gc:universal NODE_80_length_22759_cov_1.466858:3668-4633(+)
MENQLFPWIFCNSRECPITETDYVMEFDGVDLEDIYPILKKKTLNPKKTWTIIIKNSEIYFTTRKDEILRVINYVHIVENIQLVTMSPANYYRVKLNECWFYPKILDLNEEPFKPEGGLESLIFQTFNPIGVKKTDIQMLCHFWNTVIDQYSIYPRELLSSKCYMSISKILIEKKSTPDICLRKFADYSDIEKKDFPKLPYYQRYLVCAIFIGCFIPEDNDKHLFVSDSRNRRSKRRKMTTNRLELGPLPCGVPRIVALYRMLLSENSGHSAILKMLWDLQEKELIHIDDINVVCQFSFKFATSCAEQLDFSLQLSSYFSA